MRYRYWTVQARPFPTSISVIGLGVIVEDPTSGEMAHRFVGNAQSRMSRFGLPDSSNRAIGRTTAELNRWLTRSSDTPAALQLDERFTTSALLDSMVDRWNNSITVNQSQFVAAENLEEAVDFLFRKLIFDGARASEPQRVAQVRQSVRAAYESKEQLRELVVAHPELTVDENLGEQFDLGVIRETEVLELNDAFSMHAQDVNRIAERVQSWTFKMAILRSEGAQLALPDGATLPVDNRTPIVATLWPPQSRDESSLFSSMSRRWDRLEIDYVLVTEIESHAEKLSAIAS